MNGFDKREKRRKKKTNCNLICYQTYVVDNRSEFNVDNTNKMGLIFRNLTDRIKNKIE